MSVEVMKHYDKRGAHVLQYRTNIYKTRTENVFLINIFKEYEKILNDCQLQLPQSSQAHQLLDLCCGTGIFSFLSAAKSFYVRGVDLSGVSIEAARWMAVENQLLKNTEFLQSDVIEFLKKDSNQYEIVQIFASLYYFNLDEILPLISTHMKRGSLFICCETNADNIFANIYRRLKSIIKKDRDRATLQNLLSPKEMKKIELYLGPYKIKYLDFLSLGALLLKRWPKLQSVYHIWASKLDDVILNQLGLNFLAFKFLVVSQKT